MPRAGCPRRGTATWRGVLRGPPARHATLETRVPARDLTRATCARMSVKATPLPSASLRSGRPRLALVGQSWHAFTALRAGQRGEHV
eukprot:4771047-Pyramimonas_sp.AAC.1